MNSASTEYMMKSEALETRWPSRKTVIAGTSRSQHVSKRDQTRVVSWWGGTFIFFPEGVILAREITDVNPVGISIELGRSGSRECVLLPSSIYQVSGVHRAHRAHTYQADNWLLLEGGLRGDIFGDDHGDLQRGTIQDSRIEKVTTRR